MKHIPIVYPLSLLVLIIFVFFTGAYAIAEGAVGEPVVPAATTDSGVAVDDHEWYESTAIWVCPLH